jgi:drug/metabolite transporter (DMT)-like permease
VLGLLAVLGVTNYNTFAYIGLGQTTATNAVLLGAATPLIIVALSWTLLGQRPGVAGVSGLVLSLAGVAVIVSQGEPRRLADFSLNPGDLWILAAALDWALYSIWLRYRPAGLDPLVFLTVIVALGCLPLAALYAWELASGNRFAMTAPNLAALAYVAVLPSVIAYVIWNRAVAELGANRTGQYIHLMPAFGALLAWLLLGERPGWHHALGFGLIAAGILLGGMAFRKPPRGS